ncbi:MAG: hypothetical protein LAT67_12670 [Balneolales bacterium]|nr:hypothetical protein [Balneolales bacterium]
MLNLSSTSMVDTLSSAYADRWEGSESIAGADANALMNLLASYDLIFVVLAVSLIIWFVLAFYLIRVDQKISKLEQKILSSPENVYKE